MSSWASTGPNRQLAERIGEYDGILIRSATKLTAELIDRAPAACASIGRAGVGVDNVDVEAATRRGIIVANAPQSNVVTAAEHTMALLLALARNIPQALASLTSGKWERSKFSGVELYEKTLGILGFGRIGQLVAHRARAASGCACSPSIRSSAPSATASSASRRPRAARSSTRRPTSSRSICRRRPRPRDWLDAEAFAQDARRRAHAERRARRVDRRRGAAGRRWTRARWAAPRSTCSPASR